MFVPKCQAVNVMYNNSSSPFYRAMYPAYWISSENTYILLLLVTKICLPFCKICHSITDTLVDEQLLDPR